MPDSTSDAEVEKKSITKKWENKKVLNQDFNTLKAKIYLRTMDWMDFKSRRSASMPVALFRRLSKRFWTKLCWRRSNKFITNIFCFWGGEKITNQILINSHTLRRKQKQNANAFKSNFTTILKLMIALSWFDYHFELDGIQGRW